jgi:hypothetical protein
VVARRRLRATSFLLDSPPLTPTPPPGTFRRSPQPHWLAGFAADIPYSQTGHCRA